MELVHQYLSSSRSYQLLYVRHLWNQNKIQSTPEIAEYIEKVCGLNRHSHKQYLPENLDVARMGFDAIDQEKLFEVILADIIYCIDYQLFDELNDIFSYIDRHFM